MPIGEPKYTLEAAQSEAENIQEKVASGKAQDYTEAHRLLEEEKQQSEAADQAKLKELREKMGGGGSQEKEWKTIQAEIKAKIERALSQAMPHAEIQKIRNQIDALNADFTSGKISEEDYREKIAPLDYYNDRVGVVTFDTIAEFTEALEQSGVTGEYRDEILKHENEHAVSAEQEGMENYYKLHYVTLPGGGTGFIPSVVFYYPEGAANSEKNGLQGKIASAPEKLSNRDRRQLGEEVPEGEEDIFDRRNS